MNGTSRVTGDSQARFCERLGVKFPGPTRRRSAMTRPYRDLLAILIYFPENAVESGPTAS